jgi:isopentenyl-diphosphate delta-isomerase
MQKNNILLVNELNEITGFGEKMQVHKDGLLHRAFSVLIYNDAEEMLLQKRSVKKYHSGGLWTNACCGHPFNKKDISEYAKQRLLEELGIISDLEFIFKFKYKTDFNNGLFENEIDYVFAGQMNNGQHIKLNADEADDFCWINKKTLIDDVKINPAKYTVWFRLILDNLKTRHEIL